MSAPVSVLRRVATLAPAPLRRRVKRLLRDAPQPDAWRDRVEVVHGAAHVAYRGHVGSPARVVGLVIQAANDPSRRLTLNQPPAADFDFRVDTGELWQWCGQRQARYDMYLLIDGLAGTTVTRRLGRCATTVTAEALSGIALTDGTEAHGLDIRAWTHVTELGNLSLLCFPQPWLNHAVEDLDLTVNAAGMSGTMTLRTYSRPATALTGQLVERLTDERHDCAVTMTPIDPTTQYGMYSYRVTFDARPSVAPEGARDGMADPYFFVSFHGADEAPTHVTLKASDTTIRCDLDDIEVDVDGERLQLWVPYLTTRGKRLAFWIETFTRSDYAYLKRLHRWSWLVAMLRPFSGIWLVGETPDKAQGNGFWLFAWLREHHPRRRAYYVIAPDSPDRERVEALGNAVLHRSRDHLRYTLLASRIVGSHHGEFLHASRSRRVGRHASGVRIYLQHGVTAMKNVQFDYGRRTMHEQPPDHVIVNSEIEQQIFVDHLQYRPRQVHAAGFARFDALFAQAPPVAALAADRTVLVMPTWRDWFRDRDDPQVAEYVQTWTEFLEHPAVQRMRAETGCRLLLVVHPNMRAHLRALSIDGVEIVEPDADVQQLIRRCSALVTDYSSVAWDAVFLGRPVAFLQHDLDRLVKGRQPFVDSASMLPGPLCRTPSQLAGEMVELASRDFVMDEQFRRRAAVFLETPHDDFCQRNYAVIRRAGGLRTRIYRVLGNRRGREAFDRFAADESYDRWMGRLFRVGRLLPRKRTVIFETDRGKGFGGSPRAIFERLAEQQPALSLVWSVNTDLRVPPGIRTIHRRTPRWFWELSRAKYWVSNQNAEVICPRPRRTYFLQTWHGTPLKKMQNDVELMYGRQKSYHADAQRLVDDWSALVSPSEFATTAFRSAFGFDGPVLQTGTPGNDVFHRDVRDERAQLARRRLGLVPGRTVVLYAPTFRDDRRPIGGVGAWGHDMALDLHAFSRRLGEDVTLLVRLHPLVKFSWPADLGPGIVNASNYPDVQDLLLISDVLITDYSSIMFDFAQTERPIVLFTYDIEYYRDTLRGFYADLADVAPGPMLATSDEVIDAIARIDEEAPLFADRRAAFRERFGSLEDGHAAQRVVDAVFTPAGERK